MKEKKAALTIIEFDYHAEVLINALKILNRIPEYRILLFVSGKVWKQIQATVTTEDDIEVYVAPKTSDVKKLITENLKKINQSKAIFFNTLASHFKLFHSTKFTPPVILRIHNSNTYFSPIKSINPKLSVFYLWKDTSYIVLHAILKLETFYRKKFVRESVNFFQFPCSTIANYALSKNYLPISKLFPSVPYVFMKDVFSKSNKQQEVNIAILGGIDKRRRNYSEVLNAFKILAPKLKNKVVFSLVGKPYGKYGKNIVNKFKELENENLTINTFNSFVSQPVFDKITSEADFLIIPTVRETRYKLYRELYGYTKISGSVNDMVIYQKPAIIPSFYPIEDSLKPHVETYNDSEDLVSVLTDWINHKKYKEYQINSMLGEYDFEKIVLRTKEGLSKISN